MPISLKYDIIDFMLDGAQRKKRIWFLVMALGLALLACQAKAQTASTEPAHPKPLPETPEFAPDIEVEKIVFATNVSSRVPVGVSDVFDADVQEVYCWNQLSLSRVPAKVRHEWYWNDEKISESVFEVHYNRSRAWSRRKVRPGRWRVEIRDADSGRLIAVGAFVIRNH